MRRVRPQTQRLAVPPTAALPSRRSRPPLGGAVAGGAVAGAPSRVPVPARAAVAASRLARRPAAPAYAGPPPAAARRAPRRGAGPRRRRRRRRCDDRPPGGSARLGAGPAGRPAAAAPGRAAAWRRARRSRRHGPLRGQPGRRCPTPSRTGTPPGSGTARRATPASGARAGRAPCSRSWPCSRPSRRAAPLARRARAAGLGHPGPHRRPLGHLPRHAPPRARRAGQRRRRGGGDQPVAPRARGWSGPSRRSCSRCFVGVCAMFASAARARRPPRLRRAHPTACLPLAVGRGLRRAHRVVGSGRGRACAAGAAASCAGSRPGGGRARWRPASCSSSPRPCSRRRVTGDGPDVVAAHDGARAGSTQVVPDPVTRHLRAARPPARMFQGESPTEPMPMADLLRRTPYRHTRIPGEAAEDTQVRCGPRPRRPGRRADAAVRRRCAAGRRAASRPSRPRPGSTSSRSTSRCSRSSSRRRARPGRPHTLLRVVRRTRHDYARLVAVHELVEALAAGEIDVDRGRPPAARDQAAAGASSRSWAVSVASALLAAAVAVMIGASALAAVATVLVVLAVTGVNRLHAPHSRCRSSTPTRSTRSSPRCSPGRPTRVERRRRARAAAEQDFAFIVAGGIVAMLPGRTDGLGHRGRAVRVPAHRCRAAARRCSLVADWASSSASPRG